ncbi:hypothetical protein [Lachnoclostridium sp. An14]|uniref:hypothetical protein n=1 Tax=Lachnoclostridium sp. An14 TaxID=1965562 RepID=UPI0013A61D22|nr:hypothetical protein [Lachnoclostridium sp. An14]
METWRQKVGIAALFACLILTAAALCYCLFGFSGGAKEMEGTFVESAEVMAG